jgi:hypothetical protein
MQNVNHVDHANQQGLDLNQTQQVNAIVDQMKDSKADARTQVQMAMQKNNVADIGLELVRRSAQGMAQSATMSNTFTKKTERAMKKEFDQIFGSPEWQGDDAVVQQGEGIKKPDATQSLANQKQKQAVQQQNIPLEGDTRKLLEQYTKLYATAAQQHSPEVQKEIKKLEGQLFSRGIKSYELKNIQMSLMASMRAEVALQIKQCFMNRMLSTDEVVEMAVHTRGLNDVLDYVWTNQKLGGSDFGGYNTDLQGTMDRVMAETQTELQGFLKELLKEKMTRKLLAESKSDKSEVRDELKDALKIAKRVGFDLDAFVARWQKEKIHEGLFLFEDPKDKGILDTTPGGMMGGRNPNQNQNQNAASEDSNSEREGTESTEDLLTNRLRALYMRDALQGNLFARLDTSFKIRKTKNGLIRLGIYSNDLNEKVKKEAVNVAKLKTMEMIKEALYEMSTLFEMEGTAFTLVDTKLKGLLRNAQRVNLDIGSEDLLAMRDKCNLEILEVVKREHRLTKVALTVTQQPMLANKLSGLEKLMKRLTSETKVAGDTEEDLITLPTNTLKSAV